MTGRRRVESEQRCSSTPDTPVVDAAGGRWHGRGDIRVDDVPEPGEMRCGHCWQYERGNTGVSLSYNLAYALGGLAPLVATTIAATTGSISGMVAVLVVATIVALSVPLTRSAAPAAAPANVVAGAE